jgi:hypothetical protein
MNGLPYYKAYPRDFMEGTVGMRFELKAAYRLALDLIYMHGGTLPDDARYVAGALGCSVRAWNGYRAELIAMGKLTDGPEGITAPITVIWDRQARRSEARPAIPLDVVAQVRKRDGNACTYCGAMGGPLHLDHVIPWSRGGRHEAGNLVVACAPCNWSKGGRTPDEWKAMQ